MHNTVTKLIQPIKIVVLIRTTNQLFRDCIIAYHGIITKKVVVKYFEQQLTQEISLQYQSDFAFTKMSKISFQKYIRIHQQLQLE